MTAVTVEVTFDDIAEGKAGDCRRCPIALALERLLVPGAFLTVGATVLSCSTKDVLVTVDLPSEATAFVHAFDVSDVVEPFEFEIDLPDEILRQAVAHA